MVQLKIEGVNCFYDSVKVLKDVCLSVETGTFLGILGPNGSGKTTLLKSISRVLKPQTGAILLDDSDVYQMKTSEAAKNMAVVPQDSSITFSFKALDVVLMGRTPHLSRFETEGDKDIAIARQAMEYTGTWHFADRLVTELSGGERQRIIIARALTQQPKVLLLDEPTSHLDICNQLEIMDLLKHLCVEKKLLIVGVFHDFNLAARYCDSIILLKDGKIVDAGKTVETLTSDNIKKVFGIETIVNRHPVTDLPYVIPISKPKDQERKNIRVHLICGAGTGSVLMKILSDSGYTVSAGVLNQLDTDHESALMLGVEMASEAPLSPITDGAYEANLELIAKADAVILTSIPFGWGNLRNLEAAKVALKRGVLTFVVNRVPVKDRDFTKGQASVLFSEIEKLGAVLVAGQEELLHLLHVSEDKLKLAQGSSGDAFAHLKPKEASKESHITDKRKQKT